MIETPIENGLPLISMMLSTLAIGTLLIWIAPHRFKARHLALISVLITLAFTLAILAGFDPSTSAFQFVEKHSWIPTLQINYFVGVDGISVLFLPLTSLLFLGIILSSWTRIRAMPRLYFSLLLVLLAATLGTFCALDTILFFLFWETTLIPVYFLVSHWGHGPRRRYAASKYTLHMLASGIPLLLAFVLLAINHADITASGQDYLLNFDYPTLIDTPVSATLQTALFFLFLLGFAPKVPLFPFHSWLPTIAIDGSGTTAAWVTGLKLGVYGLIRYLVPLTPDATVNFHWLLAGLGTLGMIYGALMALAQTNLRSMLAYASVSHVGLVVLSLASLTLSGIQGSLFQLVNFTIVAGGLYLLSGFLHHRTGSTESLSLGGLATTKPLFSAFFFLLCIAGLGIPGTNGFPAEFLMIVSALETHTGAGLAALGIMVISAAYVLNLFRKAFLGPARYGLIIQAEDLRPRELAIAISLAVFVLVLGLFPGLVLDLMKVSAEAWVARVNGG
ncbi:MAG: NADH-quinone oxidoreductase subunit M [Magnetococcales bacterium]|nr:NADH-quinone oxidoreductase subunit M [Magnetococcales bacterium]